MSLTLGTRRTLRSSKRPVAGLWRGLATAARRMLRDAALRRELDRMDDHMLSDIGVSRAQMLFEVDRRT